ncbi:hypothetical protein ACIPYS_21540 [Kitasatospora sp. NPDC089913]
MPTTVVRGSVGYLADRLRQRLAVLGHDVHMVHRGIDKAVVER